MIFTSGFIALLYYRPSPGLFIRKKASSWLNYPEAGFLCLVLGMIPLQNPFAIVLVGEAYYFRPENQANLGAVIVG